MGPRKVIPPTKKWRKAKYFVFEKWSNSKYFLEKNIFFLRSFSVTSLYKKNPNSIENFRRGGCCNIVGFKKNHIYTTIKFFFLLKTYFLEKKMSDASTKFHFLCGGGAVKNSLRKQIGISQEYSRIHLFI